MFPRPPRSILLLLAASALVLALISGQAAAGRGLFADPDPAPVRLSPPGAALPPGMRLVYGETVPEAGETVLWLASAANLDLRARIASVRHLPGYPPRGSVSPDGSQVALLVVPESASEASARIAAELWVIPADASGALQAAQQVSRLGPWSPDSAWISFERLVPQAAPANPRIPFLAEIYRVAPGGGQPVLLLSDPLAYGMELLGWSGEGQRFLAARLDESGAWSLVAQGADGSPQERIDLPDLGLVRSFSLSPDGARLIVESMSDGTARLTLLPLLPGAPEAPVELASAPIDEKVPVSSLSARWSAAGDALWLHAPPGSRESATTPRLAAGVTVSIDPGPTVVSRPGETMLPAGCSPDGAWLLWQRYPQIYTEIFVQPSGQDALTRLAQDDPRNWLTIFGWTQMGDAQ